VIGVAGVGFQKSGFAVLRPLTSVFYNRPAKSWPTDEKDLDIRIDTTYKALDAFASHKQMGMLAVWF